MFKAENWFQKSPGRWSHADIPPESRVTTTVEVVLETSNTHIEKLVPHGDRTERQK